MDQTEIDDERRRGRLAGAAALASGILFPASIFWSQTIGGDRPEDDPPEELRFFDRHASELVASSALRTIAVLLLIPVALYLYRATKARKPDLHRIVAMMGIAGPTILALGGFAHDLYLAFAADDFAGQSFATADAAREEADDLTENGFVALTVGLSVAGTLGIAFWFILGPLNAMRVGLLTRFMGVLGVIIGPAFVLGLAPILITFWLVALGALFFGRWPQGLPPAWATGEAVPWPSARPVRSEPPEEPQHDGSPDGEVKAVGPGVRTPDDEGEGAESPGPRRKRKRRSE